MATSIDVVIPLYNCEKYILDAIRSIEKQTLPPATVLVINDGSTDASLRVVQEYQSSIPLKIISKKNGGVSSARNAGIAASAAEFIAFLDADDVWKPTRLEEAMGIFEISDVQDLGLVYCSYEHVDATGSLISGAVVERIDPRSRGNVLDWLLGGKGYGSPSVVMVRSEVFNNAGLFDEDLAGGEDHDMWIRIAQHWGSDFVNKPLVQLRQHESNAQKNADLMVLNIMKFYNKWTSLISDASLLNRWAVNLYFQLMILRHKKNYFPLAKGTLTHNAKSKLFSLQIGSRRFYYVGICLVWIRVACRYFMEVIRYLPKLAKRIFH